MDLRDPHLPECLDGEVLQAANVDGALLARLQVAAAHAQVGRRAHLLNKVLISSYKTISQILHLLNSLST